MHCAFARCPRRPQKLQQRAFFHIIGHDRRRELNWLCGRELLSLATLLILADKS
jgi:hypothetical protein